MGREPVEIRFAYDQNDGSVLIQTGIYLFNTSTLDNVAELALRSDDVPDYVEVPITQFRDWIIPLIEEKEKSKEME